MDYKQLAGQILQIAGGKENITGVSVCMTRLRMGVKNRKIIDVEKIKAIEEVYGIVDNGLQLQVILGPGKAGKVADEFAKLVSMPLGTSSIAYTLREELKEKNQTPAKVMLKKIANIFIPLIPAFVGCGLIMAVNNILIKYAPGWSVTNLSQILSIFGNAVVVGLSVFVGINTAREFGGSPMIGGVMAVILTNPMLADIKLFGENLVPGRGGVIAVLMVVIFASWLEVKIRKLMPNSLDLFLTPVLVILIAGTAALIALQPLGGFLSLGIVQFVNFAIAKGGFVAGYLLSFAFLPLVMLGLHQGLTPIHAQLIEVYGYTVLFPILAMAGAGQVGAAIAVLIKTKNKKLKKTIWSGLPVAVLGVGEPLIYGVTLPLGRPFLAACIGGGFGGAIVASFQVGAFVIGGISGIPLVPLTTMPAVYLAGLFVSYICGFIAAWFIGFEDPVVF
ncbi:Putative phosphotransferase system EIIC [Elusimicrobium minutum Pei191]|uniref:PTS system N-acetylmuramic acid-specific EIIBC component n=1 Tax=Elusimicrobium minutum (strain Pei191) TaxID=445932 RepID=B2KDM3_ELUMP|nr:PTS transporter subunit EIIC [Elusimicrobium minutum]ACC98619.1 Putative phosphotransferase system EIIC [Elusimicrobium minutum Pei191]